MTTLLNETWVAAADRFMATAPIEPLGLGLDQRFEFLIDFQRRLHDAGLAVPGWPVRFGGGAASAADAALVAGRLGELGAPEVVNFVGLEVLAPALLRFVDSERLDGWLPPMARADQIWCQLFSEPDAGSDLADLRTRAEPDGDGWRLTGSKVWCTWGHYADRGVVVARTGRVEERHRALSVFVIDMHAEGVDARPLRTMTGDAEFAEVFLRDVRVGPDALIGDVNRGWDVVLHILGSERGPYAIRRASVIRRAFLGVLSTRRTRSSTATKRQQIARAFTTMRLLDWEIDAVVARLHAGVAPGPESALTKRLLTEAEQEVMALAFDELDIASMAWSEPARPAIAEYLYSRAASIYGGTSEIQRNLIAERLLGLPKA